MRRRPLFGSSSTCRASCSAYVSGVVVGFFQPWPMGINFSLPLLLVGLAFGGEAFVESSTFIYLRAEAVFVLVRVLGHISGLCIHPTMNVRATFHVALGWRRVRRAGRFRLLGGFIHSSTCAAITRTHLCPFGLLSSAVPFMALSHISPSSYGRCSLNSALSRLGMAVMA